ncbi:MAG TPA: methyltransferase domain-containing protein, partial [Thalassobaculum sp.]
RPAEEFDRLGRLLRPGGWLAVMTRFQSDDVPFAGWHYRRDPTHVTFYREATFRRIAGQRGWHCEFPAGDVALLRR